MNRRDVRALIPGMSRLFPTGRVAVLRLYGPIGGGARTADWIELVRRLRESKKVPAVVLDIDSPGGSATASDDMFLALERLAAKKPLIAAIRGTGASGSYLAALAAHRIVAQPHAVVGSIGVISAGPRIPQLLERLGISVTENRAGRLKGMGAPWRDETDEERAKEQAVVDAFYDAFVSRVAKGRHLPEATARELATGEIWLGDEAASPGAGRRDRRPGTRRRAGSQGRRGTGSLGSSPAPSIAGRIVGWSFRHEPCERRRGRDRGPTGEPPEDVIVALIADAPV